ncbi:hypothetical protein DQ04_02311050 [Trypanosoma grayi]|uniref:hypothetical protein n=1 Tax=Trypanosoma grayi TaxID=71804 RepID=UPI0004F3FC2D|nr:hypothetical protein DQ04_02311050 [Trypanosoma grayi]KEG11753.1 hypothetical protein DQ04_02311050 [Trypanosoma grayi]
MDHTGETAVQDYPSSFTEEFVRYCRAHHLPPQLFHELGDLLQGMPRYVRLRPQHALLREHAAEVDEKVDESRIKATLATSFGTSVTSVQAVEWLPHPYYYAIPRGVAVNRATVYQSGAVSAMDAASVAAVVALRPCKGELVWDVCCSPGMKLSLMADAIGDSGVAVGTDISLDRLFTTRSVLKKHRTGNVCLFATDGTSFSLRRAASALDSGALPLKNAGNGLTVWEERQLKRSRKRRRPSVADTEGATTTTTTAEIDECNELKNVTVVFAPENARQRIGKRGEINDEVLEFDRVLVDAECSHDGSLAHMYLSDATRKPFATDGAMPAVISGIDNAHRMQRLHLAPQKSNQQLQSEKDLSPLLLLQLSLLQNGYEQLKPGGTLVYCTCSFTYQQNEFIVGEIIRRVNSSVEIQQKYRGEAVLCHPFTYLHEKASQESVSPIVQLTEAQVASLQERLEKVGDPYGIVSATQSENYLGSTFTGVRFWPHAFATSFQFISKIWKKPLQTSDVV